MNGARPPAPDQGPAGRPGTLAGLAIDGEGTRLVDDVVAVEAIPGGWRARVGFPRMEGICPMGSDVDATARRAYWSRHGSRLFPRHLLKAANLATGRGRDGFVATFECDRRGALTATAFARATVSGAARLGYADVLAARADATCAHHVPIRDADAMAAALRVAKGLAPDPSPGMLVTTLMTTCNAALAAMAARRGAALLYTNARPPTSGYEPKGYAATPLGDPYATFTSPLWRYPDIVNQRILEDLCLGHTPRHGRKDVLAMIEERGRVLAGVRAGTVRSHHRDRAIEAAGEVLARGDVAHARRQSAGTFKMMARAIGRGPIPDWLRPAIEDHHATGTMQAETMVRLALADAGWRRRLVDRLGSGTEASLPARALKALDEKVGVAVEATATLGDDGATTWRLAVPGRAPFEANARDPEAALARCAALLFATVT